MMADAGPLVTVIMPAYNAQAYITEAIRSVLAQSYANWKLIVIDDGSSDDTCRIVDEFADEDPRIVLIKNKSNLGVAKARNRGLEMSEGEYVALLDSDDIWYPLKLEKQVAFAESTQADVVYSSYAIMSERGEEIFDAFLVPPSTDLEQMLTTNVIGCSTALLRRKTTQKYQFDSTYYHEDYVYWLSLLQDGRKAAGVTDVLVGYRLVSGSRASNKLNTAKHRWKIYREYLKLPIGKSIACLTQYVIKGLIKYRSVK